MLTWTLQNDHAPMVFRAEEAILRCDPEQNQLRVSLKNGNISFGDNRSIDFPDTQVVNIPLWAASRNGPDADRPSDMALRRIPQAILEQRAAIERRRQSFAAEAAYQLLTGDFGGLTDAQWRPVTPSWRKPEAGSAACTRNLGGVGPTDSVAWRSSSWRPPGRPVPQQRCVDELRRLLSPRADLLLSAARLRRQAGEIRGTSPELRLDRQPGLPRGGRPLDAVHAPPLSPGLRPRQPPHSDLLESDSRRYTPAPRLRGCHTPAGGGRRPRFSRLRQGGRFALSLLHLEQAAAGRRDARLDGRDLVGQQHPWRVVLPTTGAFRQPAGRGVALGGQVGAERERIANHVCPHSPVARPRQQLGVQAADHPRGLPHPHSRGE